jgi:hypothetical protein
MTEASAEALAGKIHAARERGIDYLVDLQGADGSWTDMWLAVGASDAWVTGFVGTALAESWPAKRRRAPERLVLRRAAAWLAGALGRRGGWGYNGKVPPDADSTAWCVTFLALADCPVPANPIAMLERHASPGGGVRTYARTGPWGAARPDVTVASLRAQFEAGGIDRRALGAKWLAEVDLPADLPWPTYWWTSSAYPSGLALDLWSLAGEPGGKRRSPVLAPPRSAFELAWLTMARVALSDPAADWQDHVGRLLECQQSDGGWPFGRFLVVPSPLIDAALVKPTPAGDARRLLTTASAVMALTRASRRLSTHSHASRGGATGRPLSQQAWTAPPRRSRFGRKATEVVRRAAAAVGFAGGEAAAAAELFSTLTQETFAEPSPWPAAQLSSLGAGVPLEFSVVAGAAVSRSLRYSVEVGWPLLPARRRAESGVEAVRRTSAFLGYGAAWTRVEVAVEAALATSAPVPDRCRFWVWSGVDQEVGPSGVAEPPKLKMYMSLLEAELGGGRARLDAILSAAGVLLPASSRASLARLDAVGFPHEIGFGLGPSGSIALKVYYELRGWRPELLEALLRDSELAPSSTAFDASLDALRPVVPQVLSESLAAKRRAGVALRLDPVTGAVREVTTAAAFPAPLVGNAEMSARVLRWIEAAGWRSDYGQLQNTLGLIPNGARSRALDLPRPTHSLLTRTVSGRRTWTTIYVRPGFASDPMAPQPPGTSMARVNPRRPAYVIN